MPIDILIVEDDPATQDFLRLMMDDLGYNSIITSNGEEGLEIARKGTVGAIWLDYGLKGKYSGIDVVAKIRQFDDKIPILVVTAAGHELVSAAYDAGASEYLSKPFDLDSAASILGRLLVR